jgi:hypothetical protein
MLGEFPEIGTVEIQLSIKISRVSGAAMCTSFFSWASFSWMANEPL